ncbi:MAG: DinB family protein [Bryobacterales bacterium]|nr:DinB family protein [Bryobacterales bacterium]
MHIRTAGIIAILTTWSAAHAQAPKAQTPPSFMGPCSTLTCEIQNDWSRNNAMLYGLADAMPENKYTFKPTPEQQTFGERVLHVAQINVMLLQSLGAKTPAPAVDPKATSKKDSMAALQNVGEYGVAVIKEFGDQQLVGRVASLPFMGPMSTRQRILYFLMTHSQDTYGQLAVYLRLNGITPPLSRQP